MLTAGAAVAPGIFIPKFEPVTWRKSLLDDWDSIMDGLKPNPNWKDPNLDCDADWLSSNEYVKTMEADQFDDHGTFKPWSLYGKWRWEECVLVDGIFRMKSTPLIA